MTRPEIQNNRDLRYSHWHRDRLSPACHCTDLDWIEWRRGRGVVALIEAKMGLGTPLREFQFDVYTELSRRSQVPFYLVNYSEDLATFRVVRVRPEQSYDEYQAASRARFLDEKEYARFLEGLGGSPPDDVVDDRKRPLAEVY